MSQSTMWHANNYLNTNPSKEEVQARITAIEASIERDLNDPYAIQGMDGNARSIHKRATEVSCFKYYLKHGKTFTGFIITPADYQ